ncbi:class I SAM-dependent methyltransferase [Paractinoplanes durhamensis]|uniref:class I SAM-dependent methyltransferase n=1 Tax=Paractinoplanes durhamensis TaxID=113563 RepID=UPI001940E10A|nr:SAM-dependent methyltransferase [Actinoplanes durhamensis]
MQNKASRTAQQVALFRALETARGHDRVFDDPLAVRFLSGGYRWLARAARVRPVGLRLSRFIDSRWPGPRPSAVARTRLIDDLVVAALRGGARQVLLLGAGYDSRAYRLPGMSRVAVFEADHPATQAVKRRLIRGAVRPERRGHVTFVPVDLLVEDLGEALLRNGFAALEPTVVVWEGVTNYLTEAAVDATLRRLADLTATGSRLVLTYVDRRVLDGVIDAGAVAGGGQAGRGAVDVRVRPGAPGRLSRRAGHAARSRHVHPGRGRPLSAAARAT